MPGIFSRFGRGSKGSLAERHRMMLLAMGLFEQDNSSDQVEAALKEAGISPREAAAVAGQARNRFESEVLRSTSLPKSAHYDVNYYFLLGVTPTASTERIRRSYRRKAREYHPDLHDKEFSREFWVQLMVMVGDANEVLADPAKRRAYDLVWRERSEKVAAENRRNGNDRGDWETHNRLQMAELSELEDDMATQVDAIKAATGTGASIGGAVSTLADSLERYESDILGIRTETHSSPPQYLRFGETVRYEMQRKERLVSGLKELVAWLPQAQSTEAPGVIASRISALEKVMLSVRAAQNQFDISGLR